MSDFYTSFKTAERLEEGFMGALGKGIHKAGQAIENFQKNRADKKQARSDEFQAGLAGQDVETWKKQQAAAQKKQQKADNQAQAAQKAQADQQQADQQIQSSMAETPAIQKMYTSVKTLLQQCGADKVKESFGYRSHFIHHVLREEGEQPQAQSGDQAPAAAPTAGNPPAEGGGGQKATWKATKAWLQNPTDPDLLAQCKAELEENKKDPSVALKVNKVLGMVAAAEKEANGEEAQQPGAPAGADGAKPTEGAQGAQGQPAGGAQAPGGDTQAAGDGGTAGAPANSPDGGTPAGEDPAKAAKPAAAPKSGPTMSSSDFFNQKGLDLRQALMTAAQANGAKNIGAVRKADGDLLIEFGNIVKKEGR